MKAYLVAIFFVCAYLNSWGQCDFKTPPDPVKLNYACREVTFKNIQINGNKTTLAYVKKSEKVAIALDFSVHKQCDYCPGCIVQIYWGIHNYTSTCASSFGGYDVPKTHSRYEFKAPDKDGVYYVTMGNTLDYSCVNNNQRPVCDPNFAIAVLVVGTPDAEKKISLEAKTENGKQYLETQLLKSGCFGTMTEHQWYKNGKLLETANQTRLEVAENGLYRIVWKNCVGDSVFLEKNMTLKADAVDTTDLRYQIKNSDKFVLHNLEFETSKADLTTPSKAELDKLSAILLENPNMKILLEGHTDKVGKPELNLILSEQRVASTKAYLVSQGVAADRISTKSWGDTKLLNTRKTEADKQRNRRVEITILSR